MEQFVASKTSRQENLKMQLCKNWIDSKCLLLSQKTMDRFAVSAVALVKSNSKSRHIYFIERRLQNVIRWFGDY